MGDFSRRTRQLGMSKAVQRDNAGVRTTADGHANLTGVHLALDESRRLLRSTPGTVEM